MSKYKAEPLSRNEIRRYVRKLKKSVGLEDTLMFPIVEFLENIIPMIIPDFQLEIVPKEDMGNKHGETYPSKNLIRIREDVYERAIAGVPRDRLTIAHEIGHLFLHENDAIALCRMEPGECIKVYEDPEWQANCFGGELLASYYLIKDMSEPEVMKSCNVSAEAASILVSKL
jgi:Zn-dependent peptidase ImmA (M78 family)